MNIRSFLFPALLAVFLAFCGRDAAAQIRVDLSLNRSLFIRYEPLVVTVTIMNLSGRDLELSDQDNHKWFSFHIESASGALVPPRNSDYSLSPVQIPAGQSVKRAVNVTPLYPLTEYGIYRLRATIFDASSNHFYSSNPPLNVEITEGRQIWQQEVGVPEGDAGAGQTRTLTLLSHRLPDQTQLYLRIEDKAAGLVYCTHQLGRIVSFNKPDIEIDASNEIHILQNTGPKMFLYSKIGLDGRIEERKQYSGSNESRPALRRDTAGGYRIMGGIFLDPTVVAQEKAAPPPSVSDRPVALPKSQ